jgi:hypothetical protein
MASKVVRDKIKTFISANLPTSSAGQTLVDFSGLYQELNEFRQDYSLDFDEPFLAISFVPGEETPNTIASNNTAGMYREIGGCFIHIVDVAKFGVADSILTRADDLITLLRGRNIDGVRVESITTPSFEDGTTLKFDGGYISASIFISYEHDTNL